MSDAPQPTPLAPAHSVAPWPFLAGLIVGLIALSIYGHSFGHRDFHPGFTRFTVTDCPQGQYYPTLDEMKAIVRARCRKDQVLVIIGGNSILLGVWQPEADIWTKHLQETLGDSYCVINFAYRGASPTDGGAVVAEALRGEFPHMIYISNTSPFQGIDPVGLETYRWVFWEAYMQGDLERLPARSARIRELLFMTKDFQTTWVDLTMNGLDRFLRYKNLWNYVGFRYVFSASSIYGEAPPDELRPRGSFPDEELDPFDPQLAYLRYRQSTNDVEMKIVRGQIGADRIVVGPDGKKRVSQPFVDTWSGTWPRLIPADMQPKYLLLLSEESPHYRNQLSADESALYQEVFREARDDMSNAGINTMIYGQDWGDDDFGDRSHLSKYGGAKLAAQVAPEVQAMAQRLHYLP